VKVGTSDRPVNISPTTAPNHTQQRPFHGMTGYITAIF
jgi:hypothetical protein